ncbi:hypothetical protein [Streptomyces albidoflavus]|uniref:hypothetical protein n=1 Tax=Streptomyces albidoflavus TaxID=1886 RepID=UPI0033E1A786
MSNVVAHVLTTIPAAHRDRVTVTRDGDGVRIEFAPLAITPQQQDAIDKAEPRKRNRAETNVLNALSREARALHHACSAPLRAAGYSVSIEGHRRSPHRFVNGAAGLEGVTLEPMTAVPVKYGEAQTPEGKAWEAGVENGWDHANFVKAYGKQHDRRQSIPARHEDHADAYRQGWSEGLKRFRYDRYTDGEKMPQG